MTRPIFDTIIHSNDMIEWSVVYAKGRLTSHNCTFEKLGFDPFDFFNSNNIIQEGFFYQNYSKGGSERMYFSTENAGRIDYFRQTIEQWKTENLIPDYEYSYLLARIIESISFVSNTAGVYGALLTHWEQRAKKPIVFSKDVAKETDHLNIQFVNQKIEDLIENQEEELQMELK